MKEVDEKVLKNIYLNILKAILVIFYFLIVTFFPTPFALKSLL